MEVIANAGGEKLQEGRDHPNDFLHRIYAQRILEVLIPANAEQPK